jgi:hypothetical protein
MKFRINSTLFVVLFLLFCILCEYYAFSASNNLNVVVPHKDPAIEREFQNSYQAISAKPTIFTGAGAPTTTPIKIGDIYVSTTTSKIYISTSAATSGSWAIIN